MAETERDDRAAICDHLDRSSSRHGNELGDVLRALEPVDQLPLIAEEAVPRERLLRLACVLEDRPTGSDRDRQGVGSVVSASPAIVSSSRKLALDPSSHVTAHR